LLASQALHGPARRVMMGLDRVTGIAVTGI
jgi:hypothetical protein